MDMLEILQLSSENQSWASFLRDTLLAVFDNFVTADYLESLLDGLEEKELGNSVWTVDKWTMAVDNWMEVVGNSAEEIGNWKEDATDNSLKEPVA